MKKRLFTKMITTYIIVITISFIIVSILLSFWFQSYYFKSVNSQFDKEAEGIAKWAINYEIGNMSMDSLNYNLKNLGENVNENIILLDNNGYIYEVSSLKNERLIGRQINGKDIDSLRNGDYIAKTGTYDGLFNVPGHTYIKPIMINGTSFAGAIMLNTPLTELEKPLERVYEVIWMLAIFAIILVCVVTYILSQRLIIKPLSNINEVANKIAKGDIDKRVQIKSEDEIGELSKSFNYMADSIAKVEKNRREFISNVSHEIKSPITSIKGFIGAILDGVVPGEKQNYYLSLTYDEIQRLTRLVNDLLDLSTIESGQVNLHVTKFDINEVIRRTVIKFERKIQDKNLMVDVSFGKEQIYVLGDLDRILQVVTNLTDNAIKYGKKGGKIRISNKIKGNKVYISIYDESDFLSEEEIKHIWDRFYKKDKSRTSKESTGLGLPIVRSILSKHGEDIFVKNSKEGGVEFVFSLKKA
ncbi:MAG: HAMP domain-containing sensor histidine kinase [Clostridium sp.]|nr:HAMP domain-containing sensor histidine kinase [Clostridium sp.]